MMISSSFICSVLYKFIQKDKRVSWWENLKSILMIFPVGIHVEEITTTQYGNSGIIDTHCTVLNQHNELKHLTFPTPAAVRYNSFDPLTRIFYPQCGAHNMIQERETT